MEREDFIKDWLEGKIPPEELEKKLRANADDAELKNIIEESSALKVPQKRSKEEAWNLLAQKLEEKKPGRVIAFRPWALGIAASLAFLVVSYFFLQHETVRAANGEQIAYVLPDGSEVHLNADSKITFKKFSRIDARKVTLKGEAFFSVKDGGAFEVEGENGTVTVLGTSFNVNQRDQTLEVACFTGSVQVTSKEGQVITLKSGEFTQTISGQLIPSMPFDQEKEASWRIGEFYFENTSLSDVFEELERQFDVKVNYTGKQERLYTGYFNNKNLDEALQLVCTPMSLEYRKEGDTIYIE